MMNNPMKTRLQNIFIALAVWLAAPLSHAQGTTAFTYQGQLHDTGTNANGTYTMIFKLYDAASGGNQFGNAITNSPTLANGLFTVNLDFGTGAFIGFARWLDITITNGGTTQTLSPRVQVLTVPYAQFAASAAQISALTETLAGSNVVSLDAWNVGPVPGDLSHSLAFFDNGVPQMILGTNGHGLQVNGPITGDGSGLTNLNSITKHPDIQEQRHIHCSHQRD